MRSTDYSTKLCATCCSRVRAFSTKKKKSGSVRVWCGLWLRWWMSPLYTDKKISPEVVSVRLCIGYSRFLDGRGREPRVPRVFFFFSKLDCATAFLGDELKVSF